MRGLVDVIIMTYSACMSHQITPDALAERIKTANVNPRELARKFGMSENTVLKVSRGNKRVTFRTLERVANALAAYEQHESAA